MALRIRIQFVGLDEGVRVEILRALLWFACVLSAIAGVFGVALLVVGDAIVAMLGAIVCHATVAACCASMTRRLHHKNARFNFAVIVGCVSIIGVPYSTGAIFTYIEPVLGAGASVFTHPAVIFLLCSVCAAGTALAAASIVSVLVDSYNDHM